MRDFNEDKPKWKFLILLIFFQGAKLFISCHFKKKKIQTEQHLSDSCPWIWSSTNHKQKEQVSFHTLNKKLGTSVVLKIVTVRLKWQHDDYPRCYHIICSSCVLVVSRYGCVLFAPRGTTATAANSSPSLSPSAQTCKNINPIYLGEVCNPADIASSAESQRG